MNTEQFKDIPQEVFPVLADRLGSHSDAAIELAKGWTPRLLDSRGRLTDDGRAALRMQEKRIKEVNKRLAPINEAERKKWERAGKPTKVINANPDWEREPLVVADYPVQLVGPSQWSLTPEQLTLLEPKPQPVIEHKATPKRSPRNEDERREQEIIDNPSLTADEKMLRLIALDQRFTDWKSPAWAQLLGCHASNIKKTATWKLLRKPGRSLD